MAPKKQRHPLEHLLAGGTAGLVESSCCHPLDTIKTRMQLRRQVPSSKTMGPLTTATRIINREGFLSLYKGLTAVYSGIIPKMAIRFASFEQYKEILKDKETGNVSQIATFTAGLGSGLTEAVLIVTPMEVCKIRMQSQYHSMADPDQLARRKYTNVIQTAFTIVREEGLSALYKGIVPTMLRQGCNQAVNFTCYQFFKKTVEEWQGGETKPWQNLVMGGISGGFGPAVNNPLDVVKTRVQKQVIIPGQPPKYGGLFSSVILIAKEEGVSALWKGLTPRLMRIMPGQAITFMTYEAVSKKLHEFNIIPPIGK